MSFYTFGLDVHPICPLTWPLLLSAKTLVLPSAGLHLAGSRNTPPRYPVGTFNWGSAPGDLEGLVLKLNTGKAWADTVYLQLFRRGIFLYSLWPQRLEWGIMGHQRDRVQLKTETKRYLTVSSQSSHSCHFLITNEMCSSKGCLAINWFADQALHPMYHFARGLLGAVSAEVLRV